MEPPISLNLHSNKNGIGKTTLVKEIGIYL